MKSLRTLKKKLDNPFIKNVTRLAGGTGIGHIITLLAIPIITRIYSPEDFALLALYVSLTGILFIPATGKYEFALVKIKNRSEAIHTYMLATFLCFIYSALLCVVVFLYNNELALTLDNPAFAEWALLIPPGVLVLGLHNIHINWNNRNQQYRLMSGNKIIQSSGISGGQIAFGTAGFNGGGLILGEFLGKLLSLFHLTIYRLRSWPQVRSVLNKKELHTCASKHKDFPKYMMTSSVVDKVANESPVFLISVLFNPALLGFYNLTNRLLQLPLIFLGNSVRQVFYRTLTDAIQQKQKAHIFHLKTIGSLFFIALIPTLIVVWQGEWIFTIILGADWNIAGHMASILAPMFLLHFASAPTNAVFLVLNLQQYSFYFAVTSLIIKVSSIYSGYLLDNLFTGLYVMMILQSILIVLYNLIAFYLLQKQQEV